MSQSLVNIQLNDIIEIKAPSNVTIDNKQFLVIYASETKITLINLNTLEELNLFINNEGELMDNTITDISLLSRDITPSYALQNNLTPKNWIDITFKGDVPSIVTGEITNLEEDMIEIKLYPSNKLIYIDFGYKGLPEELMIKEIVIRDPPKEIELDIQEKIDDTLKPENDKLEESFKDTALETKLEEEEDTYDITLDAEKDNLLPEDKEEELIDLDGLILEGDDIIVGKEIGEYIQEVVIDEKRRRFGIETQTTDMMDDMLSVIPSLDRTPEVIKYINFQINRYKELREKFSVFDENGNANMPNFKGVNNKPLLESLSKLKNDLRWIIPVVKNRKKLYDIDLFDSFPNQDEMDINHSLLGDIIIKENETLSLFKTSPPSSFDSEYARYKQFLLQMNNFYTPFEYPTINTSVLNYQETHTDMHVVFNNQEMFDSFMIDNKILKKNKFEMSRYNLGLHSILKDKFNKNIHYKLTQNDSIPITSFLMMPKAVMKYFKVFLPETNIITKSSLNTTPLYYFKFLNNSTAYNTVLIDDFERLKKQENLERKEIRDIIKRKEKLEKTEDSDKIKFLSTITEFVFDSTIEDPDSDSYKKFIDNIIPRIRNLFTYSKEFLDNHLSVHSIITSMEPFLVYSDDITYKQLEEMSQFLKLQIIEYKKNFVQRSKEFRNIAAQSETPKVNHIISLLHNITYPDDDKQLDIHIFETLYKINTNQTTSEIIDKLFMDNNRLISTCLSYSNISLLGMIDVETEFKELQNQYNETLQKEKDENECGVFVLAKKYIDFDELMEDNSKTDVYFDKPYDTTVYDIVDNYKEQQKTMTKEAFTIFLVEELKNNIGLSQDKAIEDAEAMILKKRPVKEGHYAMLSLGYSDSNDEADVSFYKRLNNKWEKDESMASIYADNSQAFCNVKNDCFKVNNVCSTTELAESEIKKNTIKYILQEFDKKLDLTNEEMNKKIISSIIKYDKELSKHFQIKNFDLIKSNNYKFSIGTKATEVTQELSPNESIRDLILGHNDFIEKQNYVLMFCKNFTREPIHGENENWLYCKEINIPLLPLFIYKLARAYFSGTYQQTMAEIKKTQGTISDDESWWVDRHSGYLIENISYSNNTEYNEAGYAIKTGDILLEDDYNNIPLFSNTLNDDKLIDPISANVDNIISVISKNIRIFIEIHRELIISHVVNILPTIINPTRYEKIVIASQKKQKKAPSYEQLVNKSMVILTLSFLHVIIQTSIPPVKTRHTFPNCFRSFSGYPIDGDGSIKGIEYMACVSKGVSSSVAPWNSIYKLKKDIIAKEIKTYIEKYILDLPSIIDLMDAKKAYMLLPENMVIPIELTISKWYNFLPPIKPVNINTVDYIGKSFESRLLENWKSGSKEQDIQILVLKSKYIHLSMEIIKLIQNIIAKKDPILTNNLLEPFLENACCYEGTKNTYQYFISENPRIHENNQHSIYIENILEDYKNFFTAPMIISLENTRIPITVFNVFTEEIIYKTFIHYCNLNNDFPIPENMQMFFTEKPQYLREANSISEQIEELKRNGKNFDETSFNQLLSIINKKNSIDIILPQQTNNYDRINDLLSYASELDDEFISPIFIEKMLELIEINDTEMYQDIEKLVDIKEYLYRTSIQMTEEIDDFIKSFSSYSKSNKVTSINFLKKIFNWKPLNENYNTDKDIYRNLDFMIECCEKLIILFPEIIMNKNNRDNVTMPKHWGLSQNHEFKFIPVIKSYYDKLKKYMDNVAFNDIFSSLDNNILLWINIMKEIQCKMGFYNSNPKSEESYKYTTFNKNTCIIVYNYILNSIIINLINTAREEKFVFKQGDKYSGTNIDNIEVFQTDDLKLEEIDFIPSTVTENKKIIANFIVDSFLIFNSTKKNVLNFSYQDIIKKVSIEKEKEKEFEFTVKLANMNEETRRIDTLFKTHQLGDWGKGLQKGLTQYVKDSFDKEVEDREKRIILENQVRKGNNVTDENMNIFAIEHEETLAITEEIEADVFGLSDLPGDDDIGDRDDIYWDGGR